MNFIQLIVFFEQISIFSLNLSVFTLIVVSTNTKNIDYKYKEKKSEKHSRAASHTKRQITPGVINAKNFPIKSIQSD